jgi:transposase
MCPGCYEKQLRIDELRNEVEYLKHKLCYEERKTKDGYFGSSTPSSKKPFKEITAAAVKKNGGAVNGHKGYGRQTITQEQADKTEEIIISNKCPHCKGRLVNKSFIKRPIIDSVLLQTKKILYLCQKKYCPRCKKTVSAKPPVLPRALFGNQLIAQALNLHYGQLIPLGRIVEILGSAVSTADLHDIFRRLSRIWQPAVDRLIVEYRKEPVKHADETGWRTDGDNGYAWLFCSKNTSIFRFEDNRSSRVRQTVLGTRQLPGVLVTDRYGVYNKSPCSLQYCYAHILRLVEDTGAQFADNQEVQCFVACLAPLLAQAMHLRGQNISNEVYYRRAKALRNQIQRVINSASQHAGIKAIQTIFKENKHRLYHWVKTRAVPADNNRAERELRPTVIARKVSFGSQSKQGALSRSVLMTIVHTVKKRLPADAFQEWIKKSLDVIAVNPDIDAYSLLPPPKN